MEDSIACAEINFILNHMLAEDLEKIPKEFRNFFSKNRAKDYEPKLNFEQPLEKQNLSQNTKIYLAILYREFLCSMEEKEKYEKEYVEERESRLKKQLEKDIFYNPIARKEFESKRRNTAVPVIVKETSLFSKIIDKIKSFFGGNK